jgi:MoaA/NifB/PqqE/SkfB family radical SAM enzyme
MHQVSMLMWTRHNEYQSKGLKMAINKYEDIKVVHIELSTKCNALCPQCARSVFGSQVNPNIELKELSLEGLKKALKPDFVKQLDYVIINGNYGDPATHEDIFGVLEYLKTCNPALGLRFHSNGGLRSKEWWSKLGTFFKDANCWVHFGIDGLEDTNHLYRVNVKWNKLMDNVKAFLATGANAIWDYIIFKHNDQQVDKAKKLSKLLGFKSFIVKSTGRFARNRVGNYVVEGAPVFKRDKTFSHLIQATEDERWVNESLAKAEDVNYEDLEGTTLKLEVTKNDNIYRSPDDYFKPEEIQKINDCDVECFVQKEKSVFLDHNGHLWPCCWLAWPYYAFWKESESMQTRENLDKMGGLHLLDATKFDIQDIIKGPFFNYVEHGFDQVGSCDRAVSCSKTCGKKHTHMDQERGQVY